MEGYEQAFRDEADDSDFQHQRPEAIKIAMGRSMRRSWKKLARERIEDIGPKIPLGTRFWPLRRDEKLEIKRMFGRDAVRGLVTSLRSRKDDDSIEVLDAAYWMKGCSSLGRLRFAVLLGVGEPPHKGESLCLMDIKEATQAAAPRYPRVRMPRDNGEGVEGARHLAPNLGKRMLATRFLDRAVFLREILPQDLQLKIEHLTRDEAMKAARFLAMVVGRAHAQQMDVATRKSWRDELSRHRSKTSMRPRGFGPAPSSCWSVMRGNISNIVASMRWSLCYPKRWRWLEAVGKSISSLFSHNMLTGRLRLTDCIERGVTIGGDPLDHFLFEVGAGHLARTTSP